MDDILGDDSTRHVEVAVNTPNGSWPTEGFFYAPARQHVARQLRHAVLELGISDTSGWEASADGRRLDVQASFIENHLSGRVVIRYGPATEPHSR
jgi:hypothetical protein